MGTDWHQIASMIRAPTLIERPVYAKSAAIPLTVGALDQCAIEMH